MKRICVFCGSSAGASLEYAKAARALGALFSRERVGLVYGGASVGLMGALADSVLADGGEVIGIIPHHLVSKEVAHQHLSDLRVVSSMHERKALMSELADGFIALPGGFGTFEEFCEVLTWAQLGLHRKPTGLLNVAGYYDPLLTMFDRAVDHQFVRPHHRELVLSATEPAQLLEAMRRFRPPDVPKWIRTTEET